MSVGRIIVGLFLLVVIVAVVAFAVWNPGQQLNVKILTKTYERVPFVYTMFIAFVAGIVFTLIFGFLYYFEMALSLRRARKEKRQLETELTTLRNLPVEEDAVEPPAMEDRD